MSRVAADVVGLLKELADAHAEAPRLRVALVRLERLAGQVRARREHRDYHVIVGPLLDEALGDAVRVAREALR